MTSQLLLVPLPEASSLKWTCHQLRQPLRLAVVLRAVGERLHAAAPAWYSQFGFARTLAEV